MGVPFLFKWLIKKNRSILKDLPSLSIDNLFLDINGMIHVCSRNSQNEEEIIDKVLAYIKIIIDSTNIKKLLYLAIDGCSPRAKMKQQRLRRFKSMKEKKFFSYLLKQFPKEKDLIPYQNTWNSNAITPGTEFMEKLSEKFHTFFKNHEYKFSIIISDSYCPGEGEHKIMNYLRKNNSIRNETNCIYGLDADLMILSMTLHVKNMYILREHMIKNKIIPNKFRFVSIDKIKKIIIKYVRKKWPIDSIKKVYSGNIINDVIFLLTFLGNDFVPNIPSLELNEDGLNILLDIYSEVVQEIKKPLIINPKYCTINKDFFLSILKKLSEIEHESLITLEENYKEYTNDILSQNFSNDVEKIVTLQLKCTDGYINNFDNEQWKERYYNKLFPKDFNISMICKSYLEGLKWTYLYYYQGCPSWSWQYSYHFSPFISDIHNLFQKSPKYLFYPNFNKDKPLLPLYQLTGVLPIESKELIPISYQKAINNVTKHWYDINCKEISIHKKNGWERTPMINIIDKKELIDILSKLPLTEKEKKRNISKEKYSLYKKKEL